jgi:hypothetical protein
MSTKGKRLRHTTVKGLIKKLLKTPQNYTVDFEVMEDGEVTGGCAYIYDIDVQGEHVRIFVTD